MPRRPGRHCGCATRIETRRPAWVGSAVEPAAGRPLRTAAAGSAIEQIQSRSRLHTPGIVRRAVTSRASNRSADSARRLDLHPSLAANAAVAEDAPRATCACDSLHYADLCDEIILAQYRHAEFLGPV